MATSKSAKKKPAKGARATAKTKTGKKAAAAKTPATPRGTAKSATRKTDASTRRPPKRPGSTATGKSRGTPYTLSLAPYSLTLAPVGGEPVAYDILLFVDDSKLTLEQRSQIDAFVKTCGLRALVAIGKAWGRP
jgi:hypothetical protein